MRPAYTERMFKLLDGKPNLHTSLPVILPTKHCRLVYALSVYALGSWTHDPMLAFSCRKESGVLPPNSLYHYKGLEVLGIHSAIL